MRKELTEEELSQNPSIDMMFRRVKYEDLMKDVENYANEGKTIEEVNRLFFEEGNPNNKKVICSQDIYDYYVEHGLIQEENEEQQEDEEDRQEPMEISSDNLENEYREPEEEQEELEKQSNEDEAPGEMQELANALKEKEQGATEEPIEENNSSETYLTDEELEDYPDQPFKPYTEEQEEDMIQSIKINGIIQPIIVRPLNNGKYQILSGHNRRRCGKKAGLTKFPCKIVNGLTDEEAKLYMVDTNLATRPSLSPMERARALLARKNAYNSEQINLKIQSIIAKENLENVDIRKKISEIENMSNGSLQRYLRLNYLDEDLQEMVDNGRISIKAGEQLSFLKKKEQQKPLAKVLKSDEKIKISEGMAKKLKSKAIEGALSKENIETLLSNKKETEEKDKTFKIIFSESEIEKIINDLSRNEKEITEESIKEKILDLQNLLD